MPNSSQFPEIDFASRCLQSKTDTASQPWPIRELLFPLGNANASVVRKRLETIRFFAGVGDGGRDDVQHIMLTTSEALEGLEKGRTYI